MQVLNELIVNKYFIFFILQLSQRGFPKKHVSTISFMNVAMMQPTFLPWQGFFSLVYQSDNFIFLNDSQFSYQSFHQRNKLFVNQNQVGWYTTIVDKKTSFLRPLNETRMKNNLPWRKKLYNRIEHTYSKTRYFKILAPFLKKWILKDHFFLSDQNIEFILYVCKAFGWNRNFFLSSEFGSKLKRSKRVLELIEISGGTRYYSAYGAFDYMNQEEVFPLSGIETVFQQYEQVYYSQSHSNKFVPDLSILDALFNLGFESTAELIIEGIKPPFTWEEMKNNHSAK